MALPGPGGRAAILQALTRATPLAADVDLAAIGTSAATEGLSGADLAALVREAAVTSLKVSELASCMCLHGNTPHRNLHAFSSRRAQTFQLR